MDQLQALLNHGLIRTEHMQKAAIINIKERKVCASTFGFNIRDQRASWEVAAEVPPENALNLIYAFNKNLLQIRSEGLCFKEKSYKCVHVDEHSICLQNA
ncbi:PROF4 protein, partial [Eurystomus gularis]|nr:PROF4 protein [Eurystomus gularis]